MISNNISLHIAYKEGDKVKCRLSKTTEKKLNELLRDNNLEELKTKKNDDRISSGMVSGIYGDSIKERTAYNAGVKGSKSSLIYVYWQVLHIPVNFTSNIISVIS